MLNVRIYFKYPNIDCGMDINIVMRTFTGIKTVMVNGEPAKLINKTRGQYEYFDPNLQRTRLLAIVNSFLDYPQFFVDGKEVMIYPRIPTFFKVFIFLPIIYFMMFPDILWGSAIMALLNIVFNFTIIKMVNSKVLRVVLVLMMTGAWFFVTLETLQALGNLLNIESSSSSSSSSAAVIIQNIFNLI